jgi:hypothetical protein
MRHPADSKAWKHVDSEFKWFLEGGRNVRLGLASDGFNPFGMQSLTYSIWPVILVPYNLPPWMCQKQSNLILCVALGGKSSSECTFHSLSDVYVPYFVCCKYNIQIIFVLHNH